ncbi:MAG: choloylglycine hydrolase family protein [Desulfobacterales bacterium]|nr:choloylglycine hydrolase family protein [Desulfobacterales bacterium]
MRKLKYISFVVSVVFTVSFVLVSIEARACTGIRIKTKDGNYIFARTLEFGAGQMPFDLILVPRNHNYKGQTPSGKPGMIWRTKYAHVGFNPFGEPVVVDGLNEKGLACGSFLFPGCAGFENLAEKDYSRAVSSIDLPSWILSTCASVTEVREQLPKILVCSIRMPKSDIMFDLHYFVTDETGNAIIIEYVDGKLNIYDNKVNVITNCPVYDWQTTNLRNYIGLKPLNNPAIKIDGTEFAPFGQGSGAIGLPGDFSPPSRFIRAVFLVQTAYQGKDLDEGIGIAFHILNQFDIPKGSIRDNDRGRIVSDSTQWTSAADLKNRRYFYHTYIDRSVRMIDLNELDLNAQNIKSIKDVQKPGKTINLSDQLK